MAYIEMTINCDGCGIEDYTVEVKLDARNKANLRDLFKPAVDSGWTFGLRTFCPECKAKLVKKCKNCRFYENKSMCTPVCTNCDAVVLEDDLCDKWESK